MKRTLLLITTIASLGFGLNAQNLGIPDANFKAYLVGNTAINTNFDAEISMIEAFGFSGSIDCSNLGIADLTGIIFFQQLTSLNCSNNSLTVLDQNLALLTNLHCTSNSIAILNVSNNTALTWLDCDENLLTSLDVSNNTVLSYLRCDSNQISSLDVSNNTALTSLMCYDNQLTSLDVSGATDLTTLRCEVNQLTSLDVTNNTDLFGLGFSNNQLTSIDLTQNAVLSYLLCNNNQLTSLDVTQNTDLIELNCKNNQLQCLNMKNGNNTFFFYLLAFGNPNLTCIEVDDVTWSNANWTNIDAQMYFSSYCNNACSSVVGINELSNTPKQLLKIVDLMGRETIYKPNTVLIYVFDDGSAEKVFKMEE